MWCSFSTNVVRCYFFLVALFLLTSCGSSSGGATEPTGITTNEPASITTNFVETENTDWSAGTNTDVVSSGGDLVLGVSSTVPAYSFTTCGATLSLGPAQGDCDAEYTATSLDGTVAVSSSGIQNWTVPVSNLYGLSVAGAGHNSDGEFIQGAIIQAVLNLTQGTSLKILVGQQGDPGRGGSGGSFVTLIDNTPLMVAGGAAGRRSVDVNNRGSTSTTGNSVVCGTGATGGVSGNGGESLNAGSLGSCSGSGAGLLGDGQGCGGGISFVNGGTGGNSAGIFPGGFGGGAGVNTGSSPGGGGGYSGGAAYYTGGGSSCAGGGGSFIHAEAINAATSDGNYDGIATFNGSSITLLDDWNIGEGAVSIDTVTFIATGSRISPVMDISTSDPLLTYSSSVISWDSTEPAGTTLLVEVRVSTDGGAVWSPYSTVSNGDAVPGLAAGITMDMARLQTRVTLSTLDNTLSVFLHDITVSITNIAP